MLNRIPFDAVREKFRAATGGVTFEHAFPVIRRWPNVAYESTEQDRIFFLVAQGDDDYGTIHHKIAAMVKSEPQSVGLDRIFYPSRLEARWALDAIEKGIDNVESYFLFRNYAQESRPNSAAWVLTVPSNMQYLCYVTHNDEIVDIRHTSEETMQEILDEIAFVPQEVPLRGAAERDVWGGQQRCTCVQCFRTRSRNQLTFLQRLRARNRRTESIFDEDTRRAE